MYTGATQLIWVSGPDLDCRISHRPDNPMPAVWQVALISIYWLHCYCLPYYQKTPLTKNSTQKFNSGVMGTHGINTATAHPATFQRHLQHWHNNWQAGGIMLSPLTLPQGFWPNGPWFNHSWVEYGLQTTRWTALMWTGHQLNSPSSYDASNC